MNSLKVTDSKKDGENFQLTVLVISSNKKKYPYYYSLYSSYEVDNVIWYIHMIPYGVIIDLSIWNTDCTKKFRAGTAKAWSLSRADRTVWHVFFFSWHLNTDGSSFYRLPAWGIPPSCCFYFGVFSRDIFLLWYHKDKKITVWGCCYYGF